MVLQIEAKSLYYSINGSESGMILGVQSFLQSPSHSIHSTFPNVRTPTIFLKIILLDLVSHSVQCCAWLSVSLSFQKWAVQSYTPPISASPAHLHWPNAVANVP